MVNEVQNVGFNPVQKLPAYEFLNKENKQCESIRHKTHMHRDFSPRSRNRDYQLDFSLCSFHCYNTYLYMLKHPIPWTEKPSRPIPCAKIMHKTIGRFAQPNIGSKKNFPGRCPEPRRGGLLDPLKPPVTPLLRSRRNEGGAPPPL